MHVIYSSLDHLCVRSVWEQRGAERGPHGRKERGDEWKCVCHMSQGYRGEKKKRAVSIGVKHGCSMHGVLTEVHACMQLKVDYVLTAEAERAQARTLTLQ